MKYLEKIVKFVIIEMCGTFLVAAMATYGLVKLFTPYLPV